MKLDIYANGCGTGKTTRNKQLIQDSDDLYLILVPSISLANDYADCAYVVTSESASNVQDKLLEALNDNRRVICCTHTAFQNCDFTARLTKDRVVIQDEEISDVYKSSQYKEGKHNDILCVTERADGWFDVEVNTASASKFLTNLDWFENADALKDVYSSPHKLWSNRGADADDRFLFAVLSPEVYAGAKKVIITCANFTYTTQYLLWKNLFNADFNVVSPFTAYNAPNLTIFHAEQKINSKTYNTKDSVIRDEVIAFVEANSKNEKVVYVDNNSQRTNAKWVRVNHNCHGDNSNRDAKHIAFLSAINYSAIDTHFLKQVAGISYDELSYALIGELVHQVSMRGALRDNNQAKQAIYLMEARAARYAAGILFSNAKVVEIDNTSREAKAPKLTQAQKLKSFYIRKNFTEYAVTSTRVLMTLDIWTQCNSRGNKCS